MTWWMIVVVAVLYLAVARTAGGHFAWYTTKKWDKRTHLKTEDIVWAGIIGGLLWPVILTITFLIWTVRASAKHQSRWPAVGYERKVRAEARAKRLKKMERETGLDR